ncbi:MAG: NAD(P)H-binding protein [Caldilineaceae bacterium]
MSTMQKTILVTGATGNVGRAVVQQLLETGVAIRALTRNPAKANFPDTVTVFQGDLAEPATVKPALTDVDAVFLFPVAEAADAVLAAARAQNVRQIVLLSSGAVRDGVTKQDDMLAQRHANMEQAVRDSGMAWTILRPGAFATNSLQWAPQLRSGDVVRGPYAEATMAPIHEGDIAAVAVAALTDAGHEGAIYHLTGPESLTQREEVQILGEALGRDLRYEELPRAVAREQMAKFMPPPIVDSLLDLYASTVGKPVPIAPTVAEVTGRPARTFRQWATEHAAAFH